MSSIGLIIESLNEMGLEEGLFGNSKKKDPSRSKIEIKQYIATYKMNGKEGSFKLKAVSSSDAKHRAMKRLYKKGTLLSIKLDK